MWPFKTKMTADTYDTVQPHPGRDLATDRHEYAPAPDPDGWTSRSRPQPQTLPAMKRAHTEIAEALRQRLLQRHDEDSRQQPLLPPQEGNLGYLFEADLAHPAPGVPPAMPRHTAGRRTHPDRSSHYWKGGPDQD